MKTFLFSTDFSATATHAIQYGCSIADQINANILLCNAVLAPAESPQVGLCVWPIEESDTFLKDSLDQLKRLAALIGHKTKNGSFKPNITCITEAGTVYNVIQHIIKDDPIDLVVIGTSETSIPDTFLLGDQARMLIDESTRPLLLVPPSAEITPVKKIAFATDFKDLKRDMDCIYTLISLVRPLNAEILLTHIHDGEIQSPEFEQTVQMMINELSEKANYPHICFKAFENSSTGSGLEWLCLHGQIDILAMVHRSHNFIDSLFRGSQTQKMAGHLPIPLLVFPATPKPNL